MLNRLLARQGRRIGAIVSAGPEVDVEKPGLPTLGSSALAQPKAFRAVH
jgi:hypothetical protein